MDLTEVVVTVHLNFDSIDDIRLGTSSLKDSFHKARNPCKALYVFIRTALNPFGEVAEIIQGWVEIRLLRRFSIDSWISR